MTRVILPPLSWRETPNQSARVPANRKPTLIVVHRWGNEPATTPAEARGLYAGNVSFMCSARSEVSAHVVYGGKLGNPKGQATQLVAWDQKAWTQAAANSACLSIESADAIWTGHDEPGLQQLARIVAFLCHKTNIPPTWVQSPSAVGVCRHLDLGALGNPNHHVCPTANTALWRRFMREVRDEYNRGGFRPRWGRGTWRPL